MVKIKGIFKDSMALVTVLTAIVIFIGLLYLIPYLTKERLKKDAMEESQRLVTYVKLFRSYYGSDILSKIKKHTDLKVNFDHKDNEHTVPLPATVLHDMSELFTKGTDVKVQMYSNYPFPNRKDRVLDKFQKQSLAYVLEHPGEAYSKEDTIDGKSVYRTSFPDHLTKSSCVKCHNTRVDTPKNDWILGDIRGVIEIDVPLESSIGWADELMYNILVFILLNFLFLVIFYFIRMKIKNKKLEKVFTNTDKILSEYKKAVDSGAIVSKTNSKGIITYVNESFITISGYSKDDLIGKSHSIIRHPNSSSKIFEGMWKKLKNKEIWQGDIENKKKNGDSYYVFATIIPILDEEDNIVEYLAIRYDTTNLHKAIQRAKMAEKTKNEFLANMSHELRTPLNAIIGFSQILQRKDSMNDKDKEYVEKIQLSGKNLLTLVNSILDFSKIEDGKMEAHPVVINIFTLFEEILVMVEVQASDKNITISLNGFNKDKTIYVDPQLFKQAIINILSNAVKFTNSNGKIDIILSLKDDKYIFEICDNGVGIPKDELKDVFKPFKRGSSAKKTHAQGTGLGLSITYDIITKLHNGTIKVESTEDEGTCFSIII